MVWALCRGLDLWAEEVSSQWPAQLALHVRTASATQKVQTNLVGEHWGNSILAAMLVAETCGIGLPEAAAALYQVQPFIGRMQPIQLPNGAIILRDEGNGSPDTVEAAMRVFTEARTRRKVLVLGNISDSRENSRVRFRRLGQQAAPVSRSCYFCRRTRTARSKGGDCNRAGKRPGARILHSSTSCRRL